MNLLQQSILGLFDAHDKIPLILRWIGREVGELHPQNIKFHLQQLEKKGLISIDYDKKIISKVKGGHQDTTLVALPIYGTANCGSAVSFADDMIQGFLKISKKLLQGLSLSTLFVVRASGDSMNRANIEGAQIDDGDFILVEKNDSYSPKNKDYVVSLIDDCANVKKFYQHGDEIALVSESTKDYLPIFIHEHDDYRIMGKVVKVIKTPMFE
jgi:repressor LexA